MAANQVADQIYKYRLRTDQYDPYKPMPGADPDEPQPTPKQRAITNRELFVNTVSSIYTHAISTEVAKGGALKMRRAELWETQFGAPEEGRNKFIAHLNAHVQKHFYGRSAKVKAKKPKGKRRKQVAVDGQAAEGGEVGENDDDDEQLAERDDLGAKKTGGVDDLYSQIPLETYVNRRCQPFVTYLEKRAPKMSRRFNQCEGLGVLANTGGAVLAVLGYADWVALTVAVAGVAMALTDYFYYPSQLGETNRALQDCHNLLIWFDSLSLVQRKKRENTSHVVGVCEGAMLNLCQARTGVAQIAVNGEGGEEG